MCSSRWIALGVLGLSLCAGCAGRSEDSEGGSEGPSSGGASGSGGAGSTAGSSSAGSAPSAGGSTAGGSGGQPAPTSRVPERHRATAERCDDYRSRNTTHPDVSEDSPPCTTDADCAPLAVDCGEGCRASCVEYAGTTRCSLSSGDCVRDDDCTAGANGRCQDNRGLWSCSYDECFEDSACSSGGPCECGEASGYAANECKAGNCQTDADCGSGGYCSPTLGDCGNYGGIIGYHCHTPADVCVNDSECVHPVQGQGYCMYRPELGHWECGYGQCVG